MFINLFTYFTIKDLKFTFNCFIKTSIENCYVQRFQSNFMLFNCDMKMNERTISTKWKIFLKPQWKKLGGIFMMCYSNKDWKNLLHKFKFFFFMFIYWNNKWLYEYFLTQHFWTLLQFSFLEQKVHKNVWKSNTTKHKTELNEINLRK